MTYSFPCKFCGQVIYGDSDKEIKGFFDDEFLAQRHKCPALKNVHIDYEDKITDLDHNDFEICKDIGQLKLQYSHLESLMKVAITFLILHSDNCNSHFSSKETNYEQSKPD